MLPVEKEIEDFKRELLRQRLGQVTDEQRELFHRLYPKGVPSDKLVQAIDLCDRTIRKNKAGRVQPGIVSEQ